MAQRALAEPSSNAEAVFRQIDADGNGRVTMDEATYGTRALLERVFKAAGKEPTDTLSRDEFLAAYERQRNKPKSANSATTPSSSASSSDRDAASDEANPDLKFADADGDGKICCRVVEVQTNVQPSGCRQRQFARHERVRQQPAVRRTCS